MRPVRHRARVPPALLPRPLLPWALLLGALLAPSPALGDEASSPTEPGTALEQGNRQFRTGRLEQALAAYRAGWNPRRPDPVLAYNLGTTAHHLGRLPQAVLWYRRALAASGEDRWLIENLEQARRRLDAPRTAPPDLVTRLARWRGLLWILAGLAGCGALGLLVSRRPGFERPADGLTVLAAVLLAAALLLPRLAATPAVVLEPCDGLPPGAEVWVRAAPGGIYEAATAEGKLPCPPGAVEPVAP